MYNPGLVAELCALVRKYEIPAGLLNLEVTESIFADSEINLGNTVECLRQEGFVVMMDDFGSGYSSLNILKDMEVDVLKIDMGFLSDTMRQKRGHDIIEFVVQMAHKLGLCTIAEGVETEEQAEFLRLIGCDYAQGYLFAMPMPLERYKSGFSCKALCM